MDVAVLATDDAGHALATAGPYLASDPVQHNLILTLLHVRVVRPEPARYWIALLGGQPAGFVFQSPFHFVAAITAMPDPALVAVVDSIVDAGIALPGVGGEAAAAARFAGQWTERTKSAATPVMGQRIYEVRSVVPPRPVSGGLRQADSTDRELLVGWVEEFQAQTGEAPSEPVQVVDRRLSRGELWLWDDKGPTALVGLSEPVEGVVRIGPVYTPLGHRNRGYASSCVAEISGRALAQELRCILYTDLSNPTSNSIYRCIGYRAVAEVLRYRFS